MMMTGNNTISNMKRGQPLQDRATTIKVMEQLHGGGGSGSVDDANNNGFSSAIMNVYGDGPLLLSDIPVAAKTSKVHVGIDEAGRGSVLGPMIYGAAYWAADTPSTAIPQDFNDSKQLSEEKRTALMETILTNAPDIGFVVRILPASEISRNMLRPQPYNLNQMSHDSAMEMIRALIDAGVNVDTCYIDTVGNPDSYKRKLQSTFPSLNFVVESKADAKYPPCSAASVVAKVTRDRLIEHWRYNESFHSQEQPSKVFGSGYPSDPTCKKWMEENVTNQNTVFGYPDVVRFSWGPAKKLLAEHAVAVQFAADEDDEDEATAEFKIGVKRQRDAMNTFLASASGQQQQQASSSSARGQEKVKNKKRYPYFERNGFQVATKL